MQPSLLLQRTCPDACDMGYERDKSKEGQIEDEHAEAVESHEAKTIANLDCALV